MTQTNQTEQPSPFRYTVGSVLYLGSHYLQNARFHQAEISARVLRDCEAQYRDEGITGVVVDTQAETQAELWTTTSPKPSDPLTIYRRAA